MNSEICLRLVVICDYPIISESLSHMLATTGHFLVSSEPFKETTRCSSQCDLVLCICEPRPDLDKALHAVRDSYPGAKLACMILGDDVGAILSALRSGATGIIDNSLNATSLVSLAGVIQRIASGEFVISTQLATSLALLHVQNGSGQHPVSPMKAEFLTQREQEVLEFLAQGASNKEIAMRLSLSEHTVRAHLRGIMQKLQVNNRSQAVALAWRNNLITKN